MSFEHWHNLFRQVSGKIAGGIGRHRGRSQIEKPIAATLPDPSNLSPYLVEVVQHERVSEYGILKVCLGLCFVCSIVVLDRRRSLDGGCIEELLRGLVNMQLGEPAAQVTQWCRWSLRLRSVLGLGGGPWFEHISDLL